MFFIFYHFENCKKGMRSTATPSTLFPLPLVPMETYLLLDDSPAYPMTFPILLELDGEIVRQAFEDAVAHALTRHPLLTARVERSRGRACWVSAEEFSPSITWRPSDAPVATRQWLDLRQAPGLRISVLQEGGQASICFLFHHACCDGEGALRFIVDVLTAYVGQTASVSQAPLWDELQPQRLHCRGDFSGQAVVEPTSTIEKIRDAWGFHVLTPAPVAARAGHADVRTSERACGFTTSTFDRGATRRMREQLRTEETDASFNDVAIGLLFQTLAAWNQKYGAAPGHQRLRILVPTDLREKGDRGLPAANRIGFGFLTRRIDQCQSWPELIAGVSEEVRRIRRARLGLDFVNGVALVQLVPKLLPTILKFTGCISTAVLSHSGDPRRRLSRRFPSEDGLLVIGNLRLRQMTGVPPIRSGTRVAFGLGGYDGQLTISARCDPQYLDASAAQQLCDLYEQRWRDWAWALGWPDKK